MTITKADATLLQTISDKFSKNVVANYKAESDGEAVKKFGDSLGAIEKVKILGTGIASALRQKSSSYETQAKGIAQRASSVLPAMTRTFGEDFVVAAMPEEAKHQHAIDVCKEVGANDLAKLCQKAMDLQPAG